MFEARLFQNLLFEAVFEAFVSRTNEQKAAQSTAQLRFYAIEQCQLNCLTEEIDSCLLQYAVSLVSVLRRDKFSNPKSECV